MTPAQLDLIKADITANPDLAAFPAGQDGDQGIADLYNKTAVPDFAVWRTDASTDAILDAVDGTKYTPVDVPSAADLPAASALYLNRCAIINIKQMNLQTFTVGRATLNASKVGTRKGLQDCVTAVPAGANGVNVNPGGALGVTVLNTLWRLGRRIEKLLVTGTAATGGVSAGVMGFEGQISYSDIRDARARP